MEKLTFAQIRREIGHPRYVFNNAGTYEHKPFLSHSPADIKRMVNVNLLGSLWVSQLTLPRYRDKMALFRCHTKLRS